jgi:hypothetical protein
MAFINIGEPYYYIRWFDKLKAIENNNLKLNEINERRKKIGLPSINQEKILLERLLKMLN